MFSNPECPFQSPVLENIDKILAACEKELPKLGKNSQMIAYYLSGSLAKANDTQKARWQKIIQTNTEK